MTNLQEFFTRYAELSLTDAAALAGFYDHNCFIAAGPRGFEVHKNDSTFVEWLKQVQNFNRETGMESMKLLDITSETISKQYLKAKVTWAASFRQEGADNIVFSVHYILHMTEQQPLITMFISEENQEEVMKDKGLL